MEPRIPQIRIADITSYQNSLEYTPLPDLSRLPEDLQDRISKYYYQMIETGLSPPHVHGTMYTLRLLFTLLIDAGFEVDIFNIGFKELNYLKTVALRGRAISSISLYFWRLEKFVRTQGGSMPQMIFPDTSTLDDSKWLTPEQAREVMSLPMDDYQRAVVILELGMGLRKCEVIRLTLDNITDNCIYVRGKGRGGGKYRAVPYCEGAKEALQKAIEYREKLIESKSKSPTDEIPPNLFLTAAPRRLLCAYKESSLGFDEKFIESLSDRLGYKVTNHMLRRTFARQLWFSGVDILIIASILGHSNIVTTKRYIGVNISEMSIAMNTMNWSLNNSVPQQ